VLDVALGVGLALLLLTLIGLGPALLVFRGRRGGLVALALAPALGFALTGLVGSYLVLADRPIAVWAGPWLGAAGLLSLGLSAAVLRRMMRAGELPERRPLLAYAGVLVVAWLIVVSPILVGGLSYTVLRGNGTDSFNYLTTATYLQRTPLSWVFGVTAQQMVDRNMSYELARELFPQRWATSAMLAWTAWVVDLPLIRFEFGYSVLSLLLAFGPVTVLALELGLSLGVALLVALAATVGFWAQLVVDMRAQSQANAIGLLALCVYLWLRLAARPSGRQWMLALVFGLAFAALVLIYVEIAPTLIGGLVLGGLLVRPGRRQLAALAPPTVAACCVALVLVAPFWGQLVPFFRSQAASAIDARNGWSQAYFSWLYGDSWRGAWGLSQVAVRGWLPIPLQTLRARALLALGLVLTAALVWTVVVAVRRGPRAPALAVVTGVALAALLEAALLMLRGQLWAGGKAISYGYPFVLLALVGVWLASVTWRPVRRSQIVRLAGQAAVLGWLGIQCGLGLARIAWATRGADDVGYIAHHGEYRQRDWEVGAIARVLATEPGTDVWLVEPNSWVAEYLNFALGNDAHLIDLYGVRDRRGGIVARQSLAREPAYLLFDRRTWWNEAEYQGSVVAETSEFALVKPAFGPGQTPPIVDVAAPSAQAATGAPPTTLVWLGPAPTDWKLVALQSGDVELRWAGGSDAGARPTAIRLSVWPSGDEQSSWLGPGQPRLAFPVQRGLNEVQVQLADGMAGGDPPIGVGVWGPR
jgi:hypothetical protein